MAKFPDPVITAMHHAGTTVTCLPVKMSDESPDAALTPSNASDSSNGWAAAIFFVLPESWEEAQIQQAFQPGTLLPVGMSADLIEHDTATLISLEVDVVLPEEKLSGEILFIPGHLEGHHETLRLLSSQVAIDLFIGDKFCELLHQQTVPLAREHREVFADLLKEATGRDALIRFRGQYDPQAAFDSRIGAGKLWMPEPPKPTDPLN